jgi:TonB family protein
LETVFKAQERKLVWYRLGEKLPEVSPAESKGSRRPPRIETKQDRQTVVARAKDAPSARQMTWLPAPELRQETELKAPNLLAFEMPRPEPPKQIQAKLFVPPSPAPPPPREPLVLPEPPSVPTSALPSAPAPSEPVRPRGRRFEAPASRRAAAPDRLRLESAPDVRPRLEDARPLLTGGARLRGRGFAAPPNRPPAESRLILPAAPALAADNRLGEGIPSPMAPLRGRAFTPPPRKAGAATAAAGALDLSAAPDVPMAPLPGEGPGLPAATVAIRGRTFTPPPARAGGAGGDGLSLPAGAPELPAGEADLSAVVVGLNPDGAPRLPEGSRPASFSAGEAVSREGGDGDRVLSARVIAPGLMIRDQRPAPSPAGGRLPLAAIQAAPTSPENLRTIARNLSVERPPGAMDAPAGAPPATRVSAAPAPQFRGRAVYTLAIQAPSITSYSGSWLMWFAEREDPGRPGLVAPFPRHKVDPVYAASAIDERVEGSVRLSAVIRADGTVAFVSVLRGVDERLDRSAVAAFSKWEFHPALREGRPVELDAVVDIPFRLAPLDSR